MNLTHDDVQEILRILDGSSFDELQLETGRFKLTLRRAAGAHGGWTQETHTAGKARLAEATPAAATLGTGASVGTSAASAAPSVSGLIDIRPPMMGTFYRAPKPGAPPFVELGTAISEDTVIGIVETMKLMNAVAAGTRGTIVEICAADGELIDRHRVLMRVRPEAR
jgi:acetyl-CoA carboxylase biotin carboxyl carrier protein